MMSGKWPLDPDNREAAEEFLKAEVSGELTRPQLENAHCHFLLRAHYQAGAGTNSRG